jgi:hypothetical protein
MGFRSSAMLVMIVKREWAYFDGTMESISTTYTSELWQTISVSDFEFYTGL